MHSDWKPLFTLMARRARRLSGPALGKVHQVCCEHFLNRGRVDLAALTRDMQPEASKFRRDLPRAGSRHLKQDLTRFAELAPVLFARNQERDLLVLNSIVPLLNRYDHPVRGYLFLYGLRTVGPEQVRAALTQDRSYQCLMAAGAGSATRRFFFDLRAECGLTTRELTDEAARNLAQELGEVELNYSVQLADQEQQIQALQGELERTRTEAAGEGLRRLVIALQSRPTPVLTQLDQVLARLQQLEHPDADQLTVLIALEETMQVLSELGAERFPPAHMTTFALHQDQLTDYQYVAGQPFESGGSRTVTCLAPGWRVCGQVISPAQVAEVQEVS